MKWKLITKYYGHNNILDIGICWGNGRLEHIARICFPDDNQLGDNVSCAEEICAALNKRIRKSI